MLLKSAVDDGKCNLNIKIGQISIHNYISNAGLHYIQKFFQHIVYFNRCFVSVSIVCIISAWLEHCIDRCPLPGTGNSHFAAHTIVGQIEQIKPTHFNFDLITCYCSAVLQSQT